MADWWRALGDPLLANLIDTALRDSPDIRASRARVRQARAGLAGNRANLMPKVNASAAMLRTRAPDLASFGVETAGRAAVAAVVAAVGRCRSISPGSTPAGELDLLGGTRRAIEAASAEAEAADAELADAHVQLAAEVAQAYVTLREQQASLAHLRASETLEADMLDSDLASAARAAWPRAGSGTAADPAREHAAPASRRWRRVWSNRSISSRC